MVDEEAAYYRWIRDMIRNTQVTFDQFYEKRIYAIQNKALWLHTVHTKIW